VRASIFITCLTDTLFPETGRAMVALLERLGMQLDFPREQTCCGQMHYNTGYVRETLPLVRRFVRVFDRLGRSLEHLIELSKLLQQRGVDLVVLDQGIDTSTAVGPMFFHILGAIAEFEHALMSDRTLDGLAAARARGRTGGQKPKLGARQIKLAREMYDETGDDGKRKHTVAEIAAEFGVSRPTIYRNLAKTVA
jgi:hypothetical protein